MRSDVGKSDNESGHHASRRVLPQRTKFFKQRFVARISRFRVLTSRVRSGTGIGRVSVTALCVRKSSNGVRQFSTLNFFRRLAAIIAG